MSETIWPSTIVVEKQVTLPPIRIKTPGIQGGKGERGDSAVIEDVTASVTNSVGTPSVGVTLGGTPLKRTIHLDFDNLKGEPGVDGEPATIEAVNATVDQSVGTPSVTVKTGGTPLKRTFEFGFAGIKGEPGIDGIDGRSAVIKSVTATVDDKVGTPAVIVQTGGTELERTLALEFKNLKGEPFRFEDFTKEQLALLKGEKGDPFTFSDFTQEQLALLKGDKGDPFTFADFTPEQKEELRGPAGKDGTDGVDGIDGQSAVIEGATASVTQTVGTPAVDVQLGGTALKRTFAFSFANLKGEPGKDGKPFTFADLTPEQKEELRGQPGRDGTNGQSAKITNVTATVSNTVGTPSVKVTLGGTDLQRTIDLAFSGLKGQTGDAGATQDVSGLVQKSGNRGSLSGYEAMSSSYSVTVTSTSADDQVAEGTITVQNGTSGQTWQKNVAITSAGAKVSPGSNWKWAGGSAPEVKANSLLVCKWCGTFGILSLITTE